MNFQVDSQERLQQLQVQAGKTYLIEYINKDYYNGDESIEKGNGVAFKSGTNIYFNVTDPYGMDKMVMNVRVLEV